MQSTQTKVACSAAFSRQTPSPQPPLVFWSMRLGLPGSGSFGESVFSSQICRHFTKTLFAARRFHPPQSQKTEKHAPLQPLLTCMLNNSFASRCKCDCQVNSPFIPSSLKITQIISLLWIPVMNLLQYNFHRRGWPVLCPPHFVVSASWFLSRTFYAISIAFILYHINASSRFPVVVILKHTLHHHVYNRLLAISSTKTSALMYHTRHIRFITPLSYIALVSIELSASLRLLPANLLLPHFLTKTHKN